MRRPNGSYLKLLGVTCHTPTRRTSAALPALPRQPRSERLLVYRLMLKMAVRPKVDVGFVFLLSRIYHQDDICRLYLKLSLGLFVEEPTDGGLDRKSTRLNSSHANIS